MYPTEPNEDGMWQDVYGKWHCALPAHPDRNVNLLTDVERQKQELHAKQAHPDPRSGTKTRVYSVEVTVSVDGEVIGAADGETTGHNLSAVGRTVVDRATQPIEQAWRTEMDAARSRR